MTNSEYTTIALKADDKTRLDEVGDTHMSEESPSYRNIINFLVDSMEERSNSYEEVLSRAIANADEDDVMEAIQRVERDKAFVEELNQDE